MRDRFETFKVEETHGSLTIDVGQDPKPFPEPTEFTWRKNGKRMSFKPSLIMAHSNLTFSKVMRADAGKYLVFATNFALKNRTKQVGYDSSSFALDVLCKFSNLTFIADTTNQHCSYRISIMHT